MQLDRYEALYKSDFEIVRWKVSSSDAGHESQQAIGVVLVGGLIIGTAFTLFMLPTIYYTASSTMKCN